MKKKFREKIDKRTDITDKIFWRNPINIIAISILVVGLGTSMKYVIVYRDFNGLLAPICISTILLLKFLNQIRIKTNPKTILEIDNEIIKYQRVFKKKEFRFDEIEKVYLITKEPFYIYNEICYVDNCEILLCTNNEKGLDIEKLLISNCRDSILIYTSLKSELIKRGKQKHNHKLDGFVDYMLGSEGFECKGTSISRNKNIFKRVIF